MRYQPPLSIRQSALRRLPFRYDHFLRRPEHHRPKATRPSGHLPDRQPQRWRTTEERSRQPETSRRHMSLPGPWSVLPSTIPASSPGCPVHRRGAPARAKRSQRTDVVRNERDGGRPLKISQSIYTDWLDVSSENWQGMCYSVPAGTRLAPTYLPCAAGGKGGCPGGGAASGAAGARRAEFHESSPALPGAAWASRHPPAGEDTSGRCRC
jgi:hypothetical protein